MIDAYHHRQGQIRPRVPIVKIVASALTLGSGGSGGREGPIAQIGAGFGSLLGNLLHLRPAERRTLMAAGMGAGIAAIFRAPLAGALFASEVLYRSPEFEPEVIMPAAIASVVSYCTYGSYAGWQPLFNTPDLTFNSPWQLGPYLLLVLFMVLLATLYTRTFYGCVRAFKHVPLPPHFRPAIGAFLTGFGGPDLVLVFWRAAGARRAGVRLQRRATGDDFRDGRQRLGAAGHRLGKNPDHQPDDRQRRLGRRVRPFDGHRRLRRRRLGDPVAPVVAGLVPHPASFVIVGMAGFFAAAAKTPFSTLIIVSEITGGYHLLLPALWVCALAFILSDEQSIYSSQVESRSRSPAHQGAYVRQVLAGAA